MPIKIPMCLLMLTAPAWATADEPVDQSKQATAETAERAPRDAAKDAPAEAVPPDAESDAGPRTLSGMSILGNEEAPKALVIVPWKTSELGANLSLSDALDDRARPVDREVFMRELDYYALRSGE